MSALKFKSAITVPKVYTSEIVASESNSETPVVIKKVDSETITTDQIVLHELNNNRTMTLSYEDGQIQANTKQLFPLEAKNVSCTGWDEIKPLKEVSVPKSKNIHAPWYQNESGLGGYYEGTGTITYSIPEGSVLVSVTKGDAMVTVNSFTSESANVTVRQLTLSDHTASKSIEAKIIVTYRYLEDRACDTDTALNWLYEETKEANTDIDNIHTQIKDLDASDIPILPDINNIPVQSYTVKN